MIVSPVLESRLPVGSSAKIMSGCDPLLFASGEFRREMIQAIAQTNRLQAFYTGVSRRTTPDHSRKHDVLERRQFRKEKVALENKTHLLVAQLGEGRFAAAIKFLSFEFHFA